MKGTTSSAKRAIPRMPPKMMRPDSTTSARPLTQSGMPKATFMARLMELACTALNTRPKASSRQREKTTPIQRMPRPRSM
ncbi:hypothetical protein D3C79_657310 [compost metagenome]